jgi:hypothetical protein
MTIRIARRLPVMGASLAVIAMTLLVPGVQAQVQEQPLKSVAPLAPFASMRVAIFPVQFWRADTAGWSKGVDWATTRRLIDAAIGDELRERGLGQRWAYGPDVVRGATRNPTYATDPLALGVGRWRAKAPAPADQIPSTVADNLRPLTALLDTRYALIPVELRAEGDRTVLRLVLADTRSRTVIWGVDLVSAGGDTMIKSLARAVADLVVEP